MGSLFFIPSGFFFPVLSVGWSLNFEVFFYAAFGVALAFRWNVFVVVGTAVCLAALASLLRLPSLPQEVLFYVNPIMLEFFLGMLVCAFHAEFKHRWLHIGAVLAMVLVFIALPRPHRWDWFRVVSYGIPSAALVTLVASMERLFKYTPAVVLTLADASYAIYLVHVPVMELIGKTMAREQGFGLWTIFGMVFCASLMAGLLLHLYIERPLLSRLRPTKIGHRHASGVSV